MHKKPRRKQGYRNWDRRCRHVLTAILAGKEATIDLKSYKLKNLWSMLRFVEGGGCLIPYTQSAVDKVTRKPSSSFAMGKYHQVHTQQGVIGEALQLSAVSGD